ncbi:putative transcription factor bHLH family [Helianthus annuus]|nr:putative transcription factor bHLH family [Helianthus annuus]
MDSIFNLEEAERSSLLRKIIQSCGFTYICLWSHFPHHSNCLIFIDGVYKEENNQANSPSVSLAMRSFLDYKKSVFLMDNYSGERVPGFAFMHNLAYTEHTGLELLELASSSAQLQFYQDVGICCSHVEVSGSNLSTTHLPYDTMIYTSRVGLGTGWWGCLMVVNDEFKLKKLFPGDFPQEVLPQPLDQARPSSSSSSLRSLSMENNVDCPPFLFNMLHTSSYMPEISCFNEPFSNQQMPNQTLSFSTMGSKDPLQQALIQFRANQLIPSREHEEAAITRAILAVITPPPPPPSSHQLQALRAASVFKRYQPYLGPKRVHNRQNLKRRLHLFYKNLREVRAQQEDLMIHTTRPTGNQLHHMISERKRREKLNENFQALRSLLPPGSKKDKSSVLSNIKEYVVSLKSQVEELNKRNKILEVKHSRKQILNQDSGGFSDERLNVRIIDVNESTLDSRNVNLEVNVSGNLIISDLVVRVLEFMNQVENVTVMSIDAGTRTLETQVIMNQVVLRLIIQVNFQSKHINHSCKTYKI